MCHETNERCFPFLDYEKQQNENELLGGVYIYFTNATKFEWW
jgi:hypothetical protein